MDQSTTSSARNLWIGVVFFFISMPTGLWNPALPNILESYDALWVIPYATAVGPVVAIFSSLMFASMADRRMEAQKLLGILCLSGSVFLWLSFAVLSWGWNPWWYVLMMGLNALISAPTFALLTMIALVNLDDPQKKFPLFRLWGTIGWIVAGILVSWFSLDASADAGKLAAFVRLILGVMCFFLPVTKPKGEKAKNWKQVLGIEAFSLFSDRSLRVYFISSALFTIPLAAHYMYAPRMLTQMAEMQSESGFISGVITWLLPGPTAQMTLGQFTEIAAMLLMSWLGVRAKVKPLVIIAMLFGLLRFSLYLAAGHFGIMAFLWLGVSLHGPTYTFFYITGQMFVDRRVDEGMRGQAQALLNLMSASVGNTVGALSCGLLFSATGAGMSWVSWTLFWAGLSTAILLCLGYFLMGYRQKKG